MPTDSDEEDWYERRKRIDAEENRHIDQRYYPTEIPHIRRPLMLARNQALAIAGLGEISPSYDEVYEVYEGGDTYR